MTELIKVVKGDEELHIHPGALKNYENAGWQLFVAEPEPEPAAESIPESVETVAVETAQPAPVKKAARPRSQPKTSKVTKTKK
jgi:hypothetical protein